MFTLITCNLTILNDILRQAKGELKFLQHILEYKILGIVWQDLTQDFPYQMFLTASIYCLHISDKKEAYLVCLF